MGTKKVNKMTNQGQAAPPQEGANGTHGGGIDGAQGLGAAGCFKNGVFFRNFYGVST